MVSRANLSGRGKPSGVLNRVMNPLQRRSREKISRPVDMAVPGEVPATPETAARQGGGGFSGMVGRALANAKEKQAAVANRAVKPQAPPQAPGARGQRRGPRRKPTMQEIMATRGTRGPALRDMGATQEEVAPTRVSEVMSKANAARTGLPHRQLAAQEAAAAERAALEATGEVGGTRSEVDVTEPTLNEARQRRSRSGRIYRR